MEGESIVMPYGFENYRIKNNISPNTYVNEVKLIQSFLKFVENFYEKPVAPHEIRPIDVRNFLDNERRKPIKDSTVNRKLIYIRIWFNYMWETNQIPLDFMEKFKYDKLDTTPKSKIITLNYAKLLEKRSELYSRSDVPFYAKLYYLFDLRGMRRRDSFGVTTSDIKDQGNELIVYVETKDGTATFTITDPLEMSILLQAIEKAIFRDTKFLFSKKKEGFYIQETSSSYEFNHAITKVVGEPLNSELLRFAYVHYCHLHEQLKLEVIQGLLGTTLERAATILKESLVRVKNVDYNMQITT